jgi:hypothetical protein
LRDSEEIAGYSEDNGRHPQIPVRTSSACPPTTQP